MNGCIIAKNKLADRLWVGVVPKDGVYRVERSGACSPPHRTAPHRASLSEAENDPAAVLLLPREGEQAYRSYVAFLGGPIRCNPASQGAWTRCNRIARTESRQVMEVHYICMYTLTGLLRRLAYDEVNSS